MPRAVASPTPLFVSLVVFGVLFAIVPTWAADTDTPSPLSDAYCYITVSDGQENCYYYPPYGYQCDPIGNHSDPVAKNYTECSLKGVCYANMAGNTEVCYYLQPYGYQCYFKYEHKIVANMTHCDYLKSNLPPTIDITPAAGQTETNEDEVLSIKWILIDDPDSRASEPEDGYLELTFTAERGRVGFDSSYITDPVDRAKAEVVLDPLTDIGDRVDWRQGNGSLATKLIFRIRATPLQALMKSLIFLPELNWNSARGVSRLRILADDRGNSGGIPESAEGAVAITARAQNDAPVATVPNMSTDEDVVLTLAGVAVSDVDALEPGGNGILDVVISVVHGTLSITGLGLTRLCTKPAPQLCQEFTVNKRQLSLRSTQADIMTNVLGGQLKYTPDRDYFGTDTLTVTVNDLGNTGAGGAKTHTKSSTITVNSVNDAPVLGHAPVLYVVEDNVMPFLNVTIKDVDTNDGLTVKITVLHGVLNYPPTFTNVLTFSVSNISVASIQHILDTTSYTPDPDFNGFDTLKIEVDDIIANGVVDGKKTIDNIPLSVLAANDPPVLHIACPTGALCVNSPEAAYTGTIAVTIGQTRVFSSPGADNAPYVWITDVDVGNAEIQVFIHVSYGQIIVAPAALANVRVAYPLTGASSFSTVMFFGTLAHVNAALNGISYRRDFSGTDEITLLISDQGNTGLGLTGTDFITIALTE